MLHQSQLPLSFWSYAFNTAICLINRIPSSVLNFASPWERLFHKKPPLQALKTFGCACYPLLRSYPSNKLQPKSSQCIFVGYPSMSKGYICLDVAFGRIYISSHAIFHESTLTSYSSVSSTSTLSVSPSVTPSANVWLASLLSLPVESSLPIASSFPAVSTSFSLVSDSPTSNVPSLPDLPLPALPSLDSHSVPSSSLPSFDTSIVLMVDTPTANVHPMVTRSKNGIFKPKALVFATDYTTIEPSSYFVASKHKHWVEAMDSEFNSLL